MQKSPSPSEPHTAPKYTAKEARAWFYHTRSDFWWRNQMPISLPAIDALMGGRFLRREEASWTDRRIRHLVKYIDDIENRKVVFPFQISGFYYQYKPSFVWTNLPQNPIFIKKLSLLFCWTLHARCSSCHGNKFLPVTIFDKEHVACYTCLPPAQYPSIAAKIARRKLIDEAAAEYYR